MNELQELALIRAWNFNQGVRLLTQDAADAQGRFLFYRAGEELKVLARAVRAHAPAAVTDDWAALLAAVDLFGDCDNACFTTPDWESRFKLEQRAFAAASRP
ncbi:MAG: hypothetical protein KA243_02285 [Candidatus Aminicenantes bacterium]|jgi:uncharacterized protein (DUF1684 family)|nr:hypothetical protein [Candidatus Aminicenantes bacterium]